MQLLSGQSKQTYAGGTITAAYTNQQSVWKMRQRGQVILLVKYTKGDETSIQVQIEKSPDPTGATEYYLVAEIDNSNNVLPITYTITNTNSVAIPIPCVMQEQRMRISVKRTGGTTGGSGSVQLRIADDSPFSTDPLLNPTIGA